MERALFCLGRGMFADNDLCTLRLSRHSKSFWCSQRVTAYSTEVFSLVYPQYTVRTFLYLFYQSVAGILCRRIGDV